MNEPALDFRASLAAMIGICLVVMLIALDSSVVGTAMPKIVAELQGYDLYAWTASAYLLGSAITIPLAGRLGDLHGRKPFVLVAIILFTLASVGCGMANSMLQLVIARGIQGIGGGLLLGVAFACVPDLFPDRLQRVRWQVMLSSTFGVSTAIGPSLGGWLTEHYGWRSVFYVNLPVALIALPICWRFLPHIIQHKEGSRQIDWLGALFLALGITALLLTAEYGQGHGFLNWVCLGLIMTMVGMLYAFVRRQHQTAGPIVPPRVLNNRDAQKLMALGMLTGLTMFMLIFYVPLLLQGGFGMSPNEAGVLMTPLLVCVTIGSILNGRLLPRLQRAERVIFWGQIGMVVSCLLMLTLNKDTPDWWSMLVFGLCGVSLGFQLPNLTLQMMAVVGRQSLGVGTALVQTTRMVGSMIGVGIASVIVNSTYNYTVANALTKYRITDDKISALLASPQVLIRHADQLQLQQLAQQVGIAIEPLMAQARQGLITGTHHVFILCAVVAAISTLISYHLPHYEVKATPPAGNRE